MNRRSRVVRAFAPAILTAESADPARRRSGYQHGVAPATVVRELRDAGLELVEVEEAIRRSAFMVVVRRPAGPPE